ncbi:unnamed protein product, partial [Coregonus sp. 'balchen']
MESTITPEESLSSRASYTGGGGYSPMPSLMQLGRLSISLLSISPLSISPLSISPLSISPLGTLTNPEQLDEHLNPISPRRANPIWLGLEASPPRTSCTRRQSQLVSRTQQEEPEGPSWSVGPSRRNQRRSEEVRGGQKRSENVRGGASSSDSSTADSPSSSEASRPGTSGLMDHLNMALMAFHDILREVTHIQMSNAQERSVCWRSRLMRRKGEGGQYGAAPPPTACSPCLCSGSLQDIHHDCLKRWNQTKIQSGQFRSNDHQPLLLTRGNTLSRSNPGSLTLDLDDFDVEEFYQRHAQTQVEQTSPELYMILQQRFSELLQVAQSHSNSISRMAQALSGGHEQGVVEGCPLEVGELEHVSAEVMQVLHRDRGVIVPYRM